MNSLPRIACLCPTYKRPELLGNAIACFHAQKYPAERRNLVILDDAGQYGASDLGDGGNVIFCVHPAARRYPSLPAKFNVLAATAIAGTFDALVVWEDDDVYLPHHLSLIAREIAAGAEFVTYRQVWSNFGQEKQGAVLEPAAGRFHASWAFSSGLFARVGGYPDTPEKNFDQQMGAKLREAAGRRHTEIETDNPGYVYRWGNSTYHGSAIGGDEDWYQKVGELNLPAPFLGRPVVQFDAETERLYASLRENVA